MDEFSHLETHREIELKIIESLKALQHFPVPREETADHESKIKIFGILIKNRNAIMPSLLIYVRYMRYVLPLAKSFTQNSTGTVATGLF